MKLQGIFNTLLTISLLILSITAKRYYHEYDPLEAREWTENVVGRIDEHHTAHKPMPRNDVVGALTTRELVKELELRLHERGDTTTSNPSTGSTPDIVTPSGVPALGQISNSNDGDNPIFVPLPKAHDPNKRPRKSAMKKTQANNGQNTIKKVVTFDI